MEKKLGTHGLELALCIFCVGIIFVKRRKDCLRSFLSGSGSLFLFSYLSTVFAFNLLTRVLPKQTDYSWNKNYLLHVADLTLL